MQKLLIITPVKDSLATAERTIRAVARSTHDIAIRYRVYDDFSNEATAQRLDELSDELGFEIIHLKDKISTPSPNYRWILCDAQRSAIQHAEHLVIVESDVVPADDTFERLTQNVDARCGMVAAVTTNEQGEINFPYLYAKKYTKDGATRRRLSFCCTLLTMNLLQSFDFKQLNPNKHWFDVSISRASRKLGFENRLLLSAAVKHYPHSSRPWKLLKYTNPLKYYWIKITRGYDKI